MSRPHLALVALALASGTTRGNGPLTSRRLHPPLWLVRQ
jgi:hypothetical protein